MHSNLALFKDMTILYAEDEESLRQSVVQTLNIFFAQVIEAKDGEEALDLFYEKKPNILLIDISMPKINGLEFLKEIRKSNKNIPVIIMSAYAEIPYFQEAIELNVCKYVLKPFSKDTFMDALKSSLEWMYQWGEDSMIKINENLLYNPKTHEISTNTTTFILTKKESRLFESLVRQKNRVLTFKELEEEIWPEENGNKEVLKALVKELRKKLPPNTIDNVFGVGYKLALH